MNTNASTTTVVATATGCLRIEPSVSTSAMWCEALFLELSRANVKDDSATTDARDDAVACPGTHGRSPWSPYQGSSTSNAQTRSVCDARSIRLRVRAYQPLVVETLP